MFLRDYSIIDGVVRDYNIHKAGARCQNVQEIYWQGTEIH